MTSLLTRFIRLWRRGFYLALALLFTLVILADLRYWHVASEMRQAAFNLMVRHRIRMPAPDPSIVIVDIDEASLAALAGEYGRWPWPRQVFGEFLEKLEEEKPRAVVFDMLFSDPDLYNPESDSYFAEAVSRTDNTFFPFLRLDPSADSLSALSPEAIPGVTPTPDADTAATIAAALPCFDAVLATGRLGLNNIYPDPDGVAREYVVERIDHGWRLLSLPARVAVAFDHGLPEREKILLNWRGPPFTYRSVSFAPVYRDFLSETHARPANEFRDKIVIIGSTAAGLFDVKPTPMSRMHPGVEILATALDNLLHDDYLVSLSGHAFHLVISLILIWGTALGFYLDRSKERIDAFFGASGIILLAVGFASLNLTRYYLDLTGPVTLGLAYFTVARLYATAASPVLDRTAVRRSQEASGDALGVMLLIEPSDARPAAVRRLQQRLRRAGRHVELIKGRQEGFWAVFDDLLVVSWMIAMGDEKAHDAVMKEAERIRRMAGDGAVCRLHEGPITGGADARASWRRLFAAALLARSETP